MFICTKCGLCCRNIDKIPKLAGFHIGDGVCIYLSEDNLCNIYSTRPDICNVEKMYNLYYKVIM
ncbi:MAG: YkgJ family cysteine cluster protein [Firmicutes bacterium]|nr:YkgJ family cysteine cluster protein [Bacillota bacterium]